MEGKKLKYPRKVTINVPGTILTIEPILYFANKYKRGDKARVTVTEYSKYNLRLRRKTQQVNVRFWTYEPIGQLRASFRDEMKKTDWYGSAIVEGWYCPIPSPHARKTYGLDDD